MSVWKMLPRGTGITTVINKNKIYIFFFFNTLLSLGFGGRNHGSLMKNATGINMQSESTGRN
jgi:hypothetical protein